MHTNRNNQKNGMICGLWVLIRCAFALEFGEIFPSDVGLSDGPKMNNNSTRTNKINITNARKVIKILISCLINTLCKTSNSIYLLRVENNKKHISNRLTTMTSTWFAGQKKIDLFIIFVNWMETFLKYHPMLSFTWYPFTLCHLARAIEKGNCQSN